MRLAGALLVLFSAVGCWCRTFAQRAFCACAMRRRDAAETLCPGRAAEPPPFMLVRADSAVSTCRSWFTRFVLSILSSFTIDSSPFNLAISSPSRIIIAGWSRVELRQTESQTWEVISKRVVLVIRDLLTQARGQGYSITAHGSKKVRRIASTLKTN
jgi:hypothetical protein